MKPQSIYALRIATWLLFALGNRIVEAVESYRSPHGAYPRQLEELVPRFMAEVPSAKPVLMADKFRYWQHEGKPQLMYVEVPPFGRRVYSFEERTWQVID